MLDRFIGLLKGGSPERVVRIARRQFVLKHQRYAVAYSGGGDSLAILHMLRRDNPLVIIVDHQMSAGSQARTKTATARAEALGLTVIVKVWDAPPDTAMQADARKARYTLLGEACREHGMTQLVTGHTLDDQIELGKMSGGQAVMSPVTHAPVWPGLRDVDIVRPALMVRREGLRDYNKDKELAWIDDPANLDPSYHRVRVRMEPSQADTASNAIMDMKRRVTENVMAAQQARAMMAGAEAEMGVLRVPRHTPPSALRLAIACMAGSDGLPSLERVEAVAAKGGTLGGTWVQADETGLYLSRDPGAILGRVDVPALAPISLLAGETIVWDGRLTICAAQDGLMVKPIGDDVQAKASGMPHELRRTLPGIYRGRELLALPGWQLDSTVDVSFDDLTMPRLDRMISAYLRSQL